MANAQVDNIISLRDQISLTNEELQRTCGIMASNQETVEEIVMKERRNEKSLLGTVKRKSTEPVLK